MKLDLGPVRSGYVTPDFGSDQVPMSADMHRRVRRPMMIGAGVIAACVLGLGLWASLSPLATGVTAAGEVRVESSRKTLRHREAGTIRQILVTEGQRVRAGQPLITFQDIEPRAAFDIYQSQHDSLLAQIARFTAEATGRPQVTFPPDLMARMSDPRVAGMIRDQQFLFLTRTQLQTSQLEILEQRLDQLQTQIAGQQAQMASIDEQARLTNQELDGYKILNQKGYAPNTLILRYERTLADLGGRKGMLQAEIARLRQQMGETRIQMASLRDQRQSQAAEGIRESQTRLADVGPRFTAARENLAQTIVRSPVDGYVFGLRQFTVGGVTAPDELLMEIVPADAPLIVTAMIKPQDSDDVRVGMEAMVRLSGLNPRFNKPLPGTVTVVSADVIVNERAGTSGFRIDVRIDPKDLAKLEHGAKLAPGMPADVMVVTGKRTVMGFLISPITETLQDAFREH